MMRNSSLLTYIIWSLLLFRLCETKSIPPVDYNGNNSYGQDGQRKAPMPYGNGYNQNEGNFGQQNSLQNQQQQKMKEESEGSDSDEASGEGAQNFSQGQGLPEGQKFGNVKNGIGEKNDENFGRNKGNNFEQPGSFGRPGMNDSFNRPTIGGSFENQKMGFGRNPENGINEDNGYPQGFEGNGMDKNFDRKEQSQGNNQFNGNPGQDINTLGRGQKPPPYGMPEQQNMQGNPQLQGFPENKNMNLNGKPENKKGENEIEKQPNGSEDNEQLDEQEKQFLFQIYPFLKNVTVDSILSFRALIREKDLTKGDLEKKREEWLQKESEEIQKAYTDWKQHLNDKKQIANENNANNVKTSSADTQELYKTILSTIADQNVSRHQECVNIRDAVNKTTPETRNEFSQKVKLRVINFCLEEEEQALIPSNMPGQNNENSMPPTTKIGENELTKENEDNLNEEDEKLKEDDEYDEDKGDKMKNGEEKEDKKLSRSEEYGKKVKGGKDDGDTSSNSGEEHEGIMKNGEEKEEKNSSKANELKEVKKETSGEDENEEEKKEDTKEGEKDEKEGKGGNDVKKEDKDEDGSNLQKEGESGNPEDNEGDENEEEEKPEVDGKD